MLSATVWPLPRIVAQAIRPPPATWELPKAVCPLQTIVVCQAGDISAARSWETENSHGVGVFALSNPSVAGGCASAPSDVAIPNDGMSAERAQQLEHSQQRCGHSFLHLHQWNFCNVQLYYLSLISTHPFTFPMLRYLSIPSRDWSGLEYFNSKFEALNPNRSAVAPFLLLPDWALVHFRSV